MNAQTREVLKVLTNRREKMIKLGCLHVFELCGALTKYEDAVLLLND